MKLSLLTQPVNRLLIISFTLIALVPVSVLGIKFYQAAWDDAWREIYEKHRLLALNLTLPIEIYINDHRTMLMLMASTIAANNENNKNSTLNLPMFEQGQKNIKSFKSLLIVDLKGETQLQIQDGRINRTKNKLYQNQGAYLFARDKNRWFLSGVQRSPVDEKPTLILAEPVRNAQNKVIYVLLGELSIELIEKLRRNIKFGVKGHSAIVDNYGRVIAHPNPSWMATMEDLSDWDIVKKMLAGETGVTEFYSSFIGENMVAGYTAVPKYGWGVMVPQPKSEVEARVYNLLISQLSWSMLGLLLAVILAIALARWITAPINRLVKATQLMNDNDYVGKMPPLSLNAPHEITQLTTSLSGLISGLQESRTEVTKLSLSLKDRVNDATAQLLDANSKLIELVDNDLLTRLSNRRHFEESLQNSLNRRSSDIDSLCIVMVDVDDFKLINEKFGHPAGDAVLVQLSSILASAMRSGDLVARYGDDEFVAHMRCKLNVGRSRASEIKVAIEKYRFHWKGTNMHVTASMGLLYCNLTQPVDLQNVLREIDKAIFKAKHKGKNEIEECMYN